LQWTDVAAAAERMGVSVGAVRLMIVRGQLQNRVTTAGQSQVRSIGRRYPEPARLELEPEDESAEMASAFDPTPLDRAANWVARHEVVTWGAVIVMLAAIALMGTHSRNTASAAHVRRSIGLTEPDDVFSVDSASPSTPSYPTTAPATRPTSRPIEGIDNVPIHDRIEGDSSMLNVTKDLEQLDLVGLFYNQLQTTPIEADLWWDDRTSVMSHGHGFNLWAWGRTNESEIPAMLMTRQAGDWQMYYVLTEYRLAPPLPRIWNYVLGSASTAASASPRVVSSALALPASPPAVGAGGDGGSGTSTPTVGAGGPPITSAPEPGSLLLLSLGSGPILLSRSRRAGMLPLYPREG
jgi:hypothetical protein